MNDHLASLPRAVALALSLAACGSATTPTSTPADASRDVSAAQPDVVTTDAGAPEDVPPARDVAAADRYEPPVEMSSCDALQPGTVSNFMVDGLARSFILTLPNGADAPGGRWPVVFQWHGAGDNAANFNGLLAGQVNNAAMPFILVTPVSTRLLPTTMPIGFEWEQLQARGPNREARLFDAVLNCVRQRYGLDDDRVYTVGFSAGALMSDLLGVLRGDRLAGVVAFSGGYFANPDNPPTLGSLRAFVSWPEPFATNRYAQMIAVGGARDTYPLVIAQARFDLYAANDVPWLTAAGHDVVACDHNMGHTIPRALMGPAIVQFISAHRRGGGASPWAAGLPSGYPEYCQYHPGAGR